MLRTLSPLARRKGTAITYYIYDTFASDFAAGALNNTPAEPLGGLRHTYDPNGKLSTSAGALQFATGGLSNQDRVYYDQVVRALGVMCLATTFATAANSIYIGFDNNTVGTAAESILLNATNLNAIVGGVGPLVGTLTNGSTYRVCYVSRGSDSTTGSYIFVWGPGFGSGWSLVWAHSISGGASANIPTLVRSSNAVSFQVDEFKVLNPQWLPTPLAYDNFKRANGSAGSTLAAGPEGQALTPLAWSSGAVVGNQMVITPTFGANLITNGGFATDTVWNKGTGWTIGGGVASKAAGTQSDIGQGAGTVNRFYEFSIDVPSMTVAGSFFPVFGNGGWIGKQTNTAPSLGVISSRWQMSSATLGVRGSSTIAGTLDNVSVREINIPSMFSVLNTSTADVFVEVAISSLNGTSAGLVLNMDNEANPQNYVIAWHDGVNIHLDKCVNGVLTSLLNAASTYSGLAYMKVTKFGTKYRLYYANIFISTEQTITDATVISNTKHGLYSTYGGNVFDNYLLLARGTNNEYADLDNF